nr:hypothetical protein [Simplicispira lacusdiani]
MSSTPPRTPPRFVPTLTEVVRGDAVPASRLPLPAAAPPTAPPPPPAVRASIPAPQPAPPAPQLPEGFEEHMVHRVMQRVDVMLETRLREAIATVVQEQTRSVLPRLREEVESVVRHCVYEAVADELANGASQPVLR